MVRARFGLPVFAQLLAALFSLALTAITQPVQAQNPPLEAFAALPRMSLPELSPDGRRLAFVSWQDGVRYLAVRDLATGTSTAVDITSINPRYIRWGSDRYLLLSASEANSVGRVRGTVDISAVISFDLDNDMEYSQLLRPSSRTGLNYFMGEMVYIDRETEEVYIPAFDRIGNYDLLAVEMDGSGTRIVGNGGANTRDWVVNARGEPVARVDFSTSRNRQRLMARQGNRWEAVLTEENVSQPVFTAQAALPDGEIAVSFIPRDPDGVSTRNLYSMSLENGEVTRTLFADDRYDLDTIIRDPYSFEIVGITYDDVFTQRVWFDEVLETYQTELEAAFGGAAVRLLSWSQDRQRVVILVESEREAPTIYLFDVAAQHVGALGAYSPGLFGAQLQPRVHIQYPARDGVRIPAYLTLPEGAGPHPTVLLPHGGPRARDTGGYDFMAHFFASRGYAVMQPNFRGSDGYGAEWAEAAYGEWGLGVIQHDLTDAVAALVTGGISDPDRICIVGWSYGGYAALAGAAFTPDLYSCAVSIAGVADLPGFIDYQRDRYGADSVPHRNWSLQLSGEERLREGRDLREISPRHHAEKIQIPVLLFHGENDSVVPDSQSQRMRRAIRGNDGDVRYIELEDGGHSLLEDEAMRIRLLSEIETFLDTHIGSSD